MEHLGEIGTHNKKTENISQVAENMLQDGNINQQEAQLLGSYLHERGKITQEGRKNWTQLSYELRKDIQQEIGVTQDGKIGQQTIQALKNLAEKEQTLKIVHSIAEKTQDTGKIIKNQGAPSPNNHQVIEGQTTSDIIFPSPDYMSVSIGTTNDSTFSNEKDSGDSFGFQGEIKSADAKLQGSFNGFTAGEYFYYKDGEKVINTTQATRLDSAQINFQKSFYSEYYTDGSYVNFYAGAGIQTIGDLGGSNIQNTWHEVGGWYKHHGKYETLSKTTGTFNASLEGKKYFSNSTALQPFLEGNIDIQKSFDTTYGTDSIRTNVKVGVDYDDFTLGAYSHFQKRRGVNASDTINQTYKNEQNTHNGFFVEYRHGDFSYNVAYSKDEIYLGGKINF